MNNNKSLIVYFSLSGNTKEAAQVIQKDTGADIFRLTAKDPYPADYDDYAKRGDYERRHQIHPAIKNRILDWDKYQVIYLGFPTWWQQPPMIIHTLFDDYSFAGKTIVPFTTSMSTPMADSMPYIRKMAAKDHAQVVPGYRYDGDKQGMRKWLQREHLLEK
ncbi:flavodoxin [Ligilactobacillus saerimneri]|nr:flavodoxin [Ligilactobacillus saerimneri]